MTAKLTALSVLLAFRVQIRNHWAPSVRELASIVCQANCTAIRAPLATSAPITTVRPTSANKDTTVDQVKSLALNAQPDTLAQMPMKSLQSVSRVSHHLLEPHTVMDVLWALLALAVLLPSAEQTRFQTSLERLVSTAPREWHAQVARGISRLNVLPGTTPPKV